MGKYSRHNKIRIGYFSADFGEHPVTYLTTGLFESHDRNQFEIIAFSFGPERVDNLKSRVEKAFDQFIDVREKSDIEIALLARKMKIDVAIDLGGWTAGNRVGAFANILAPIQVNYLGFPGTMGADFINYIIADSTVIPQDKQGYYTEKVVYLPGTLMVNDSSYQPSDKIYSRADFGLPQNSFVFACFNGAYKITPTTFAGWMRILNVVPNSILWLFSTNETAMENLKTEANKHGINGDRIIFAPRMPLVKDHLNRIRLADLFLDTFPYNAHTTANDALRVGLPVLTLMGESFPSRVAASLLNVVGLSELITTKQETYESLAIELATNPNRLRDIKIKLLTNLPSTTLCNTKLFTENLESAYQIMYQRYQEDLSPEHIIVT
jgi:predicted O-linked N-acetylglucosamine transferase (SPINDLY family)